VTRGPSGPQLTRKEIKMEEPITLGNAAEQDNDVMRGVNENDLNGFAENTDDVDSVTPGVDTEED
jgi:hypothetical protein